MSVRAKFIVSEIADRGNGKNIKAHPVCNADGEGNKDWSKWTPSGSLEMFITNPPAADQFKVGKAFYLDITEAE